jgi:hypothetical protein
MQRKRSREQVSPERSIFSPRQGLLNRKGLDDGVLEFQRREECEEDCRTLIASDVPLQKWLSSSLNERVGHVFIEAIFNGEFINESTTADLYIVKVQNQAHEAAFTRISAMFVAFNINHGDLLLVGGGNMVLPGCVRRPDSATRPLQALLQGQSELPTGILEVDFKHRSLLSANNFCCQYFPLIHNLQVVNLFKFFPRRVNRTFAALAVQYRRNLGAVPPVHVVDAVSFGTAPLPMARVPAEIVANLRILPIAPAGAALRAANPWALHHQARIRVLGADIFHLGAPGFPLIVGTPIPAPDCDLDLYEILKVVDGIRVF